MITLTTTLKLSETGWDSHAIAHTVTVTASTAALAYKDMGAARRELYKAAEDERAARERR